MYTKPEIVHTTDTYFVAKKNWAPRGAITAQVLYKISRGWVTHNDVSPLYKIIILFDTAE